MSVFVSVSVLERTTSQMVLRRSVKDCFDKFPSVVFSRARDLGGDSTEAVDKNVYRYSLAHYVIEFSKIDYLIFT